MADIADKHKALGNAAFQAGRHKEAIVEFSRAIEAAPENHVLYSNRSAAHAALKHFDLALKDAEQCVSIKPDWAKGYSRMGAAQHGLGDLTAAAKSYEKGLEVDPQNAALQSGMADVTRAMQQDASAGLGAIFNESIWAKLAASPSTKGLLQNPAYVEKIKGIIANPSMINTMIQDPEIMQTLQVVLGMGMAMDPGAQEAAERAAAEEADRKRKAAEEEKKRQEEEEERKRKEAEAAMSPEEKEKKEKQQKAIEHKDQGNVLYKAKKFDEALAQYDTALELDPDNISFFTNKASVLVEQGKLDEAIEVCQKAIDHGRAIYADYKLLAKAFLRMGNAYLKKDDLAKAIDSYQRSLMENRTPEALKKLNETEKLKKKREAEAYINPEISEEEKQKGNECFKTGDLPQAIKHYSEAIKRNPTNAALYSNRAATYTRLQALNEALKDCDKCLDLDPSFIKGYTRKATVYYFRKEYHKCMDIYDQALKIDPENAEVAEGIQRTVRAIDERNRLAKEGKLDKESMEAARNDPEVQRILADPQFRIILDRMNNDPKEAAKAMQDPVVSAKINKLVAAGVIQMG